MPRRFLRPLLLVTAALCATGCNRAPALSAPVFQTTDISGAKFGRDFALSDHLGQPRSLADYRGKVVALLFGYVHCPDMCPITLLELKQTLHRLGPLGRDMQVLFVTLDPEHDTQALLATAMTRFDPAFVGLRGNAQQTRQIAQDFNLVFQRIKAVQPGGESIDHSAGTYIYDRQGKLRLYAAYGVANEALEHDLRLLLSES